MSGGAASGVTIRRLEQANFALVAEWLSDPAIHRTLTAEWRGRKVDATVLAIASRNRRNLFFQVEHEGRPCGLVAFSELEPKDRSAMVWYLLGDRTLGGKGVTTAAVRAMCDVGFTELGLACIWAMALASNAASRRVLEKAGFRPAGRLRQVECVDGVQEDRVYLDLLASERTGDAAGA